MGFPAGFEDGVKASEGSEGRFIGFVMQDGTGVRWFEAASFCRNQILRSSLFFAAVEHITNKKNEDNESNVVDACYVHSS